MSVVSLTLLRGIKLVTKNDRNPFTKPGFIFHFSIFIISLLARNEIVVVSEKDKVIQTVNFRFGKNLVIRLCLIKQSAIERDFHYYSLLFPVRFLSFFFSLYLSYP